MKCIIIAGGTPPSLELLKEEIDGSAFIICADSGADCLLRYNITPQYLIGDFDSINRDAFNYLSSSNCNIERYPVAKDCTDSELALLKAKELGVDKIVFLGCTGSRLDHTLGNFGLLLKCLNSNIKGYIRDANNYIELLNSPIIISGKPKEKFSLLAYNSTIKNLTIYGAGYPLNNYELSIGDSLTVSNEFKDSEITITFSGGYLLLFRSKD
ncbi:thiamine diphosphokinase [Candidatus Clostridium stratigraminis]|uniref:Thiamine diphosphokinase n=1 Tax=Candidatus Clostridium stratigraminis TaxID=3381661 RepID=A0ABW8T3E1_9CLOT